MAITWDDVEAIAPSLSTVSAEAQAIILEHVRSVVTAAQWDDRVDLGQTYLAAHLGFLASSGTGGSGQAVGPIVSETVGPLSRTFAVLTTSTGTGAISSTTWGQEYERLRKLLPSRFGLYTGGSW